MDAYSIAKKSANATSSHKEKPLMTPDEVFLRHQLRSWERRFVDGTTLNITVISYAKEQYWRKYGWDELRRIVKEVTMEVAHELSKMREGGERISNDVRELRPSVASSKRQRKPR